MKEMIVTQTQTIGQHAKSHGLAVATAGMLLFGAGAAEAMIVLDFGAIATGREQGAAGQGLIDTITATPETPEITLSSPSGTEQFLLQVDGVFDLLVSADGGVPYLDKPTNVGPAGFGVCTELNANGNLQCDPSSDDNVSGPSPVEAIHFEFFEPLSYNTGTMAGTPLTVNLNPISYFGANHNPVSNGLVNVAIDGGSFSPLPLGPLAPGDLSGTKISYQWNDTQFYVNKATVNVPEPLTIALIGAGLVGAGCAVRSRSKVTRS